MTMARIVDLASKRQVGSCRNRVGHARCLLPLNPTLRSEVGRYRLGRQLELGRIQWQLVRCGLVGRVRISCCVVVFVLAVVGVFLSTMVRPCSSPGCGEGRQRSTTVHRAISVAGATADAQSHAANSSSSHGEALLARVIADRPRLADVGADYSTIALGFVHIADKLARRGIRLDWDPTAPNSGCRSEVQLSSGSASVQLLRLAEIGAVNSEMSKRIAAERLWGALLFEMANAAAVRDIDVLVVLGAAGWIDLTDWQRCIGEWERRNASVVRDLIACVRGGSEAVVDGAVLLIDEEIHIADATDALLASGLSPRDVGWDELESWYDNTIAGWNTCVLAYRGPLAEYLDTLSRNCHRYCNKSDRRRSCYVVAGLESPDVATVVTSLIAVVDRGCHTDDAIRMLKGIRKQSTSWGLDLAVSIADVRCKGHSKPLRHGFQRK